MIVNPIIPIWLMLIICTVLIFLIVKNKEHKLKRVIIVTLLFVINLRIMLPNGKNREISSNLDVVFVIDNTISMIADDYEGKVSRLEAVKEDMEFIVDKLNRSEIFSYYF
ncbi:MAG: hypothetical protein HFJ50_08010 [Clostridia bacterium]|jgi:Ca-activated chloride channel family protein|nr:hypothetical protein [Clostridia bacterium]